MQDTLSNRLEVVSKMNRALECNNFQFLQFNADMSKNSAVKTLTTFGADNDTNICRIVNNFEQCSWADFCPSACIHGATEGKSTIAECKYFERSVVGA